MKKTINRTIILVAAIVAGVAVFSSVFVFDPFKLNLSIFKHELSIDKTANVISKIKKISEFTTACYYEELVIQKDKYKYFERKLYDKESSNENLSNVKHSAGSAWNRVKGAASKAAKAVKENSDTTTMGKLASVASAAKDVTIATGAAAIDMASATATEIVDLAKKDEVVIDSSKVGDIVFIVKTKVRAGFDLSKIGAEDLVVKGDTLSIKLPAPEIFDIIANPSDWEIYYREGEWEDEEIRAIQSGAKEGIRQDAIEYGIIEKAESFGKESLASLFKTFGFSEVNIY